MSVAITLAFPMFFATGGDRFVHQILRYRRSIRGHIDLISTDKIVKFAGP